MKGNGKATSPYIIESVQDFLSIPNLISQSSQTNETIYFELGADIDLSNINYTPISLTNVIFDGNLYTIFGLDIDKPNDDNIALFYEVKQSKIQNLVVKYFKITARDSVASLTVSAENSEFNKVGIYGVEISGLLTVAGMCAQMVNCNVKECFVENSVIEGQSVIGGLAAVVSSCNITESYTRVFLKQKGHGTIVGGFIGRIFDLSFAPSTLSYCFSDTTVTVENSTDVAAFVAKVN